MTFFISLFFPIQPTAIIIMMMTELFHFVFALFRKRKNNRIFSIFLPIINAFRDLISKQKKEKPIKSEKKKTLSNKFLYHMNLKWMNFHSTTTTKRRKTLNSLKMNINRFSEKNWWWCLMGESFTEIHIWILIFISIFMMMMINFFGFVVVESSKLNIISGFNPWRYSKKSYEFVFFSKLVFHIFWFDYWYHHHHHHWFDCMRKTVNKQTKKIWLAFRSMMFIGIFFRQSSLWNFFCFSAKIIKKSLDKMKKYGPFSTQILNQTNHSDLVIWKYS